MTIRYNNVEQVFEYVEEGNVLAVSKNLQYLKQKVKSAHHGNLHLLNRNEVKFTVSERFQFIERFTKGVANGVYPSLVVVGDPGVGKSYTVIETLKKQGLKEIITQDDLDLRIKNAESDDEIERLILETWESAGDFIVIKGFSTPKMLYRLLWEYNGKIIVIDDADSAFKHPDAANVLKAALDSNEHRIITWGAEKRSADDELPMRFSFTGRVIFISNLPLASFPQAILSRSIHVDLTLSIEEKIERIEQIFANADSKAAKDVIEFIRKYAKTIKEISVRTAIMLMKIRTAEQDDHMFERMALYYVTA